MCLLRYRSILWWHKLSFSWFEICISEGIWSNFRCDAFEGQHVVFFFFFFFSLIVSEFLSCLVWPEFSNLVRRGTQVWDDLGSLDLNNPHDHSFSSLKIFSFYISGATLSSNEARSSTPGRFSPPVFRKCHTSWGEQSCNCFVMALSST